MKKTIGYPTLLMVIFLFVNEKILAQATNKIDSTGPVGIGTISPISGSKLEVSGTVTISGDGRLKVNTSNWPSSVVGSDVGRHIIGGVNPPLLMLWNEASVAGGNYSSLILGAKNALGSTYIGGASLRGGIENDVNGAGYLAFGVTNTNSSFTEHMRISSAGYVGLGITSPSEKFQVNGGRIYANGTGTSSGFTFNNWSMYQSSGDSYNLRYNTTDVFTASSGGAIGIGTTSPSEKFQVNGGRIYANGTGTSSGFTFNNWSMYQTSGDFYNLRHNNTDVLTATNGGYVGIGTASPAEKLDVNGNAYVNGNVSANGFVKTKKLIVTQLGWSDYVFAEGYKLRSISSLESFIKQNKHLPEMPSAKDVEANGISVGDNQALLLKKIEELTLYIIEQQKEISAQNKRIRKLENQNNIQ